MENPEGNGSRPASTQLVNVEARPGSEAWTASVVSGDIVEGESTQGVGRREPLNGATPRGIGASGGRLRGPVARKGGRLGFPRAGGYAGQSFPQLGIPFGVPLWVVSVRLASDAWAFRNGATKGFFMTSPGGAGD